MNPSSPQSLAQYLVGRGVLDATPLNVIDVGCSGGLIAQVRAFEPALKAVGFDVMRTEIRRLRSLETSPGVIYENAYVGSCPTSANTALCDQPHDKTPGPEWNSSTDYDVFRRSSTAVYWHRHGFSPYSELLEKEDRRDPLVAVRLDDWLDEHEWSLDFLKTDTDGHDLDVLMSLGDRLNEPLAVHVEVYMDVRPQRPNSLGTVWDFLASRGFRLYDLELARFSRAALPMPFEWDMPAQTTSGQLAWGTGVFFKDLIDDRSEPPERLFKSASLFDQFGLQDCALELLEAQWDRLGSPRVSLKAIGDVLARRSQHSRPLDEIRHEFDTSPDCFFRSAWTAAEQRVPDPNHNEIPMLGLDSPITAGSEAFEDLLVEGWHPSDLDGAWTAGPDAAIRFRTRPDASPNDYLTLRLGAPVTSTDQHVTHVEITTHPGHCSEVVTINAWDQEVSVSLPRESHEGQWIEVRLTASPMRVPKLESWSNDSRNIGVFLRAIGLSLPKTSDAPHRA